MPARMDRLEMHFCPPYTSSICAFDPHFISWSKLVNDQLREREFEEYEDMRDWPVLVLDDVGSDRDPSGFSTEQLVSLLESRERKWTVITSNLYLRQLGEMDPRIASRMIRNTNRVVQMPTIDFSMR